MRLLTREVNPRQLTGFKSRILLGLMLAEILMKKT